MYELPPVNFASSGQPPPRVSVLPRIGVLIVVWLVLLAGYAAYRLLYQPAHAAGQVSNSPAPAPAMPADWNRHVENLSAAGFESDANLRQAEDQLRRTLALTDSFLEARHLHAALASIEATHQGLVRSRHDVEALQILLKEEKSSND